MARSPHFEGRLEKGNQQKLFALAEDGFARTGTPGRVTTTERRSGATITRFLHTITVRDAPVGVYGAEELWRVEQVPQHDNGKSAVEVRFFSSSPSPRKLSPTEKLQLVRLHEEALSVTLA